MRLPLEVVFGLSAEGELRHYRLACTSLAVPPEATAEGSVLLAHNEDMTAASMDDPYVVVARPAKGPPSWLSPMVRSEFTAFRLPA